MLKDKINKLLEENSDISTMDLAKKLEVSEYEVLQNVPQEIAKAVDASKFDEVIEDISKWGKILMLKITPSFVIEIKDHMPLGTYGHGYYNLGGENSSISGHLKVSDMDKIIFVSKKMRGRLSYSVVFYDKKGEHILKIFVTRDKEGELLENQVNAFIDLKNRL